MRQLHQKVKHRLSHKKKYPNLWKTILGAHRNHRYQIPLCLLSQFCRPQPKIWLWIKGLLTRPENKRMSKKCACSERGQTLFQNYKMMAAFTEQTFIRLWS